MIILIILFFLEGGARERTMELIKTDVSLKCFSWIEQSHIICGKIKIKISRAYNYK